MPGHPFHLENPLPKDIYQRWQMVSCHTARRFKINITVQIMAQLMVKDNCRFLLRITLQRQYHSKPVIISNAGHIYHIIPAQRYLAGYA